MLKKDLPSSALDIGELDIRGILGILRRNWVVLVSLPLVTLACLWVFLLMVNPTWESVAILEIGKIGRAGEDTRLIESPNDVIFRLSRSNFIYKIFQDSKQQMSKDDMDLLIDSIRVSQVKKTDMIQIEIRAYSPEKAKEFMEKIMAHLIKTHKDLTSPVSRSLDEKLRQIVDSLKEYDSKIKVIQKRVESFSVNHKDLLIGEYFLERMKSEYRSLSMQRLGLEEQMHPVRSFMTRLVDEIVVSDSPVYPRKGRTSLIVLICSVFFAAILILVRNIWQTRSK